MTSGHKSFNSNRWAHVCYCRLLCLQELNDLNKWGLNIFHVAEFSNNRPLSCMMFAIFQVSERNPTSTTDYEHVS